MKASVVAGSVLFSLLANGQLRLAMQADPRTLDPHLAADEPSDIVRYLTSDVLVRVNRLTQEPEAHLAEKWSLASQGKLLRVVLRPGIRFADGRALTARDVCSSFERILDPKLDSPDGESLRNATSGIVCREAPGGVELSLTRAIASPERWLEGVAIVPAGASPPFPALGPFQIAEAKPGSHVLLRRNPQYWKRDRQGRTLPYLDWIRLDVQRNRDLELMRFRSGDLHILNNLDPELMERLDATERAMARDLGDSLDSEQMWFNQSTAAPLPAHKKKWFGLSAFRQAVSLAIRRDDLVKVVYRGHASPAAGPVSPANKLWYNPQVRPQPADPKRAMELLQKEGFRLEGGTLCDREGHAVEFTLITNGGNKPRERMAAMIQQDLATIGIRVTPVPLDFPSLIERITKTFNYDACLLGLVNSDLDPVSQMSVWMSSGPNHQWNPNQQKPATVWEAEVDRLMQEIARSTTYSARKKAFDRVQAIAVAEQPFIYLVTRHALIAARPQVKNLQPGVLRPQTLWNAELLRVE